MHLLGPSSSSPPAEDPTRATTASSNTSATTSATPRSRRRTFSHFRKLSHPSPPTKERTPSAYEAWIENALLLAHTPDTAQQEANIMARRRSGSQSAGEAARDRRQVSGSASNAGFAYETGPSPPQNQTKDDMPTIRLIPHQDPRSHNRPSLAFPPTTRTLPRHDSIIRVGRYSERDVNPSPAPNTPSSAPVGFKSKVVSRRHCEFWYSQGQWYIKDVKSSSGTFLNHIRLSQPSVESRPFPVNDGDVVQLGIDFRGGEEMIFRCVKIRVECNRGWQKTLNTYNVSTHKKLRDLGRTAPKKDSDAASLHASQECSICLMSIAPCQSLFVAPCSHVWHYKCIRPILNDHKTFPQFLCPNCRAVTDLNADIDDPLDRWEDVEDMPDIASEDFSDVVSHVEGIDGPVYELPDPRLSDSRMNGDNSNISNDMSSLFYERKQESLPPNTTPILRRPVGLQQPSSMFDRRNVSANGTAGVAISPEPVEYLRPITPTEPLMEGEGIDRTHSRTPTTEMLVTEGPMTPTNTAGPFVFDGSAGRISGSGTTAENASAAA